MNRWQCEHHGCKSEALGVGGAIGLRAVGWWFVPGDDLVIRPPLLLCPLHRPDPRTCEQEGSEPRSCSRCSAEAEARGIQRTIRWADWVAAAVAEQEDLRPTPPSSLLEDGNSSVSGS